MSARRIWETESILAAGRKRRCDGCHKHPVDYWMIPNLVNLLVQRACLTERLLRTPLTLFRA